MVIREARAREHQKSCKSATKPSFAWVAESVEQRTRNAQVRSSNLLSGSKRPVQSVADRQAAHYPNLLSQHLLAASFEFGRITLKATEDEPLNAVELKRAREGKCLLNSELSHIGRRRSGRPPRHIRRREIQLSQLAEQSPDGGIELLLSAGQHW